MRVAITRALPEAESTAARVRALGHEAIVAPLLTVAPVPFNPDTTGAQALLFTSINGVRTFAAASDERTIPLYTVGDATAAASHDAGFADVRSADGAAGDLVALVQRTLDPAAGKLIHFSGADIAGDIVAELTNAGFAAERHIAYQARAAEVLPDALRQPFDLALFHSARAAETFARLGGQGEARAAACLSPAVAEAVQAAGFQRVIVAPAPREDALLAAALGG